MEEIIQAWLLYTRNFKGGSRVRKREGLRNNIKGFVRAAVFTVIFLWIFCLLANVFIPDGTGGEDGMESRISKAYRGEDTDSLSVVFVGNSDVYRAISPVDMYMSTGVTSAVAGQPGKKMVQAVEDVRDIFRYQKPDVIVLETDCMFRGKSPEKSAEQSSPAEKGAVEKASKIWKSFTDKGRKLLKEGDSAFIAALNYKAPLIRYHDNWKNLSLSSFTDVNRKYRFTNKGMVYSDAVKPYEGDPGYMKDPASEPEEMEASSVRSFERIRKMCRAEEVKLVLLTVPSANTWTYARHNAVRALADRYGLAYYDYNVRYPDGFDWETCTTDRGNHLNYRGGAAVTADFGERLTEDIKVKRTELTEDQKKAWEEDYFKFHESR